MIIYTSGRHQGTRRPTLRLHDFKLAVSHYICCIVYYLHCIVSMERQDINNINSPVPTNISNILIHFQ